MIGIELATQVVAAVIIEPANQRLRGGEIRVLRRRRRRTAPHTMIRNCGTVAYVTVWAMCSSRYAGALVATAA